MNIQRTRIGAAVAAVGVVTALTACVGVSLQDRLPLADPPPLDKEKAYWSEDGVTQSYSASAPAVQSLISKLKPSGPRVDDINDRKRIEAAVQSAVTSVAETHENSFWNHDAQRTVRFHYPMSQGAAVTALGQTATQGDTDELICTLAVDASANYTELDHKLSAFHPSRLRVRPNDSRLKNQ